MNRSQCGGGFGGWGLMMGKGKARFVHYLFDFNAYVPDAQKPLSAGEHEVCMEFAYAGGGLAKAGAVTLYYGGEQVGESKVMVTGRRIFDPEERFRIARHGSRLFYS